MHPPTHTHYTLVRTKSLTTLRTCHQQRRVLWTSRWSWGNEVRWILEPLPVREGSTSQTFYTSAVVDTSTQHQSTVMEGQLALVLQCEVSDYWPDQQEGCLVSSPFTASVHHTWGRGVFLNLTQNKEEQFQHKALAIHKWTARNTYIHVYVFIHIYVQSPPTTLTDWEIHREPWMHQMSVATTKSIFYARTYIENDCTSKQLHTYNTYVPYEMLCFWLKTWHRLIYYVHICMILFIVYVT